jgi:hypothetical protein
LTEGNASLMHRELMSALFFFSAEKIENLEHIAQWKERLSLRVSYFRFLSCSFFAKRCDCATQIHV